MQIAALTGSVGRSAGFARSEAAETPAPAAQAEKPQEPYFSPVFRFDKAARVLVFQFRDSETGNVTRQYPSEKVVKLYRDNAPKDVAPGATVEPRRAAEAPAARTSESTESSDAPESAPADTGSAQGTERVRVTA